MSHDPLFESAWAKWAQGVKHFHALKDDIGSFNAHHDRGPVLDARTEYHAKRHGFVTTVERIEPIPVPWALMLGDTANNFRAALDHLAWALILRGRTPPGSGKLTKRQENAIGFPICQYRQEFNAAIRLPSPDSRPKLPGIRRADSAKLRWHQPYRYSPRGLRSVHPLSMLASINNGDKHRTIQPVWVEPAVLHIEVSHERDCQVRAFKMREWRKNPLKPGAQLAYIGARRTGPNPQIQVKLKVTADPTVGEHMTIQEWGTRTAARLAGILGSFAEPPEELVEPLADLDRLIAEARAIEPSSF